MNDDLSAYILGKIRSILDWVSGALVAASQKLSGEVIQPSDQIQYNLLIILLEKLLKVMIPMRLVKQIAPLSLEKALQLIVFDSCIPGRSIQHDSILGKS